MNEMSEDVVLVHHGIKGMKWGVRRYRNSDGTLTDAGLRRYKKNMQKVTKLESRISKDRMRATRARYDATRHEVKRDKIKSRPFQTDISIWRANRHDRKRAKAMTEARRYDYVIAKHENTISRLLAQNGKMTAYASSDYSEKLLIDTLAECGKLTAR